MLLRINAHASGVVVLNYSISTEPIRTEPSPLGAGIVQYLLSVTVCNGINNSHGSDLFKEVALKSKILTMFLLQNELEADRKGWLYCRGGLVAVDNLLGSKS